MISFTPEQIIRLARLSRLKLTAAEQEKLRQELALILGHFDKIKTVPAFLPGDSPCLPTGAYRSDEMSECPDDVRRSIIANFPRRSGRYVKTDKIFN